MKKILLAVGFVVIMVIGVVFAEGGAVFAETRAVSDLVISAVNAGYTSVQAIGQNYDFVEIYNTTGARVLLDGYRLEYINSSGNVAGSLAWAEGTELHAEYLVLGYAKSPQYVGARAENLYNFGSGAGLASTAWGGRKV